MNDAIIIPKYNDALTLTLLILKLRALTHSIKIGALCSGRVRFEA